MLFVNKNTDYINANIEHSNGFKYCACLIYLGCIGTFISFFIIIQGISTWCLFPFINRIYVKYIYGGIILISLSILSIYYGIVCLIDEIKKEKIYQ